MNLGLRIAILAVRGRGRRGLGMIAQPDQPVADQGASTESARLSNSVRGSTDDDAGGVATRVVSGTGLASLGWPSRPAWTASISRRSPTRPRPRLCAGG